MRHNYEAWLDMRVPGWRDEYNSAEEAMVELGFAEPEEIEAEQDELDYSERAAWSRIGDYLDDDE